MSTPTQLPYTLTAIQHYMLTNPQPFGFVTSAQMPAIVRLDPLCPMLIRFGCNRYVVPACLVKATIEAVTLTDYLRDVSFTTQILDEARASQKRAKEEGQRAVAVMVREVTAEVRVPAVKKRPAAVFNENDCGGVFDGNRVTSDADPGL